MGRTPESRSSHRRRYRPLRGGVRARGTWPRNCAGVVSAGASDVDSVREHAALGAPPIAVGLYQRMRFVEVAPFHPAFIQGVFKLEVEQSELDHLVLGSPQSQLVIVQVPASIASQIHIADPPVRRTLTPVKLVFDVERLSAARGAA